MCPKLRFLIGIIFVMFSLLYNATGAQASSEETYFIVTAYYSPLEGQVKYTTGSYAGDIRLNGEGHTTASGKSVFPGLLAGPANYPFGTKIYFEGLGIGSIEDRGGAIVKAGNRGHSYDRIDIWMGYGDEGLQRALNWGTRTIKGKIVVPSAQVSLSFGESQIGNLTKLNVNPEADEIDDIKALQKIFTKAELYDGEIDGKYTSIRKELVDFQLKSGVIQTKEEESAGWYGPKTIAALREEYGNDSSTLIEEPKEDFAVFNHKQASEKYKIILEYGDLQINPDSSQEDIKLLQEMFQDLDLYDGDIDGEYDSISDELIDLQIMLGLVDEKDDWGAGYFGNKTKSALWVYYEKENDEMLQENAPSYGLSASEKEALDTAVENIKSNYSEEFVHLLSQQIDSIISDKKYEKYKEKLEYIKEIL